MIHVMTAGWDMAVECQIMNESPVVTAIVYA